MDYIDYLGIVALLKALLLLKAVVWPAELRGTARANHRTHLTREAAKCRLINNVLHKKITFTDTIKRRGPDGKLNLNQNFISPYNNSNIDEGWRKVFVEGIYERQTKEELISVYHRDGENGAHLGRLKNKSL